MSHLLRTAAPRSPLIPSFSRSLCNTTRATPQSHPFLRSYRLALAVTLPTAALLTNSLFPTSPLQCAEGGKSVEASGAGRPYAAFGADAAPAPDSAPESVLNFKEMGFGTVAGIAVGIFVIKGLKTAAFLLGGVFVLMQYFSSRSFININWSALTNSYDSFITKRAGPTSSSSNRAVGLWNTFIDFVAADVQGRATFVAGVLLGIRLG